MLRNMTVVVHKVLYNLIFTKDHPIDLLVTIIMIYSFITIGYKHLMGKLSDISK
jgi:hypothetical protein